MTHNAFILLFVPACLAVSLGAAVGFGVDSLIRSVSNLLFRTVGETESGRGAGARAKQKRDDAPPSRGTTDREDSEFDRDELSWFGLCRPSQPSPRRDEMNFLSPPKAASTSSRGWM